MKWGAYWRLMRFTKPSGILLLWFPTAWALWIANHGLPSRSLLIYFSVGTVLMRAAGCIINDMTDRHIDIHVARTDKRPLATGEVSLLEAFILLIFLLLSALYIVIQLPIACFYYAVVALLITILYPFCKRFFEAPQMVLGLAFSMGIPMAYLASHVAIDTNMLLLFLLNFAWIVAYDTMYAMADRKDDLRIGVKSTAVLFAESDCAFIASLQVFFHLLWLYLAYRMECSSWFYWWWLASLLLLSYQQYLIGQRNTGAYLKGFSMNVGYGLLMWLALT